MPTLTAFLSALDATVAASPSYQLGGDGAGGVCDCIGLIIGSIRRAGGIWSGLHGSNHAARHAVAGLSPITSASELAVGEAVFKARQPDDPAYALPARYADDPDPRDYYHVGVVRSVAPLRIVHCTTPGIVTDTALGRWAWHGRLTAITDVPAKTATVTAATGSTVNLRSSPDGSLLARIPVGATATILSLDGQWAHIQANGRTGWMQTRFLTQPAPSLEERIAACEARLAILEGGGAP